METITYQGIDCRVMSHNTKLPHIVIENMRGVLPFHQKLITQQEYKDALRGRPLKKAKGESFKLYDETGQLYKIAETWILCKQHKDKLEQYPQHKNTRFLIK